MTARAKETSAVSAPDSYFRSIPMIYSSVNLDFFIAISLGDGLYLFLDKFAGLRAPREHFHHITGHDP